MHEEGEKQLHRLTGELIQSLSFSKLEKYCAPSKDISMYKYVLVTNLLRNPVLCAPRRPISAQEKAVAIQELEQQWFDTCLDKLDQDQEASEEKKEDADFSDDVLAAMSTDTEALNDTIAYKISKEAAENSNYHRQGDRGTVSSDYYTNDSDRSSNKVSYNAVTSLKLYPSLKSNTFRNGCRFLMCSSI